MEYRAALMNIILNDYLNNHSNDLLLNMVYAGQKGLCSMDISELEDKVYEMNMHLFEENPNETEKRGFSAEVFRETVMAIHEKLPDLVSRIAIF